MPDHARPILGIGAGGIVRDAHLPAYQLAEFEYVGLYDPDVAKAKELAKQFNYNSVMQVPRIDKITLNMGLGEAVADKKALSSLQNQHRLSHGRRLFRRMKDNALVGSLIL